MNPWQATRRCVRWLARRAGYRVRGTADGVVVTPQQLWGQDAFADAARLLADAPVRTVFDIGANRGETVLELHALFPDATIHAFEPDPTTFDKLRLATAAVGAVRCHGFGLGAEDGTATLYLAASSEGNSFLRLAEGRGAECRGGWGAAAGAVTVPVRRLDTFCREAGVGVIDLLKIDVQGFEGAVIAGGGEFLRRANVRAVLVEAQFQPVYEVQAAFTDLFRSLDERGFRLVDLYNKNRSADGRLLWCDLLFS